MQTLAEKQMKYDRARDLLINIIAVLTIIPLAPLINRYLPPLMLGSWNADLTVSILLAALITRALAWIFKPLIIPGFLVLCTFRLINEFNDGYSFGNVVKDYKSVVLNNWKHRDIKERELFIRPGLFESSMEQLSRELKSKVNHKDPVLRNFAVLHSLDYFDEYHNKYGQTVRWLSLFKYINNRFKYVPDAQRDEYFASPDETIMNGLGGDCDDHTILMVSALKSIGARTRMIITDGHVYPELYCGNKQEFDKMQQAILFLFANEVSEGLHFRESQGEYWINLDYTAKHPGGPYLNDIAYAVIDL
jgi:hypothetical protein